MLPSGDLMVRTYGDRRARPTRAFLKRLKGSPRNASQRTADHRGQEPLTVTPEQAEQLSLASHQTTIQMVLRNSLDCEVPRQRNSSTSGWRGSRMRRDTWTAIATRHRGRFPGLQPSFRECGAGKQGAFRYYYLRGIGFTRLGLSQRYSIS
jgi:hypothetical protein